MLCGEYAVLGGATAICAAVDRRALVTVRGIEGDHHIVRAPGFSTAKGVFREEGNCVEWEQGSERFDLLEQVWQRSSPAPDTACEFVLDTSAFHDRGTKIGVGSSAALTVALATALEAIGGGDAIPVARSAHRAFQGGVGSGIDIASSQHGGVIAFRAEGPAVTPVEWPESLHYAVFWSGVAADTPARIKRFDDGIDRRLVDCAERSAQGVGKGTAADVVAALREYTDALRAFDQQAGLGIFDAGHAALVDAAVEHDVVYKPCGAGGGDVGIAVATSAESLASFTEAASGFERLAIRIDPAGARLDEAP